jgi:hypothetical protein
VCIGGGGGGGGVGRRPVKVGLVLLEGGIFAFLGHFPPSPHLPSSEVSGRVLFHKCKALDPLIISESVEHPTFLHRAETKILFLHFHIYKNCQNGGNFRENRKSYVIFMKISTEMKMF